MCCKKHLPTHLKNNREKVLSIAFPKEQTLKNIIFPMPFTIIISLSSPKHYKHHEHLSSSKDFLVRKFASNH